MYGSFYGRNKAFGLGDLALCFLGFVREEWIVEAVGGFEVVAKLVFGKLASGTSGNHVCQAKGYIGELGGTTGNTNTNITKDTAYS